MNSLKIWHLFISKKTSEKNVLGRGSIFLKCIFLSFFTMGKTILMCHFELIKQISRITLEKWV